MKRNPDALRFSRLRLVYAQSAYNDKAEHESDPAKALSNQRKHGVAFDEAATCLLDPMALVREDDARLASIGTFLSA
jgi:hypothetical protein